MSLTTLPVPLSILGSRLAVEAKSPASLPAATSTGAPAMLPGRQRELAEGFPTMLRAPRDVRDQVIQPGRNKRLFSMNNNLVKVGPWPLHVLLVLAMLTPTAATMQ